MIAPQPAKTSANVPITSATSDAEQASTQQQPALAAGSITGSPFLAGSVVFTALTIAPCIPSAT